MALCPARHDPITLNTFLMSSYVWDLLLLL